MGITMFFLALIHGIGLNLPVLPFNVDGVLTWYHDFGNLEPLVSLFVSNTEYGAFIRFPFETLGAVTPVIFFIMAATSHDFWLVNLTALIWQALHMGVYLAYALVVSHVILGPLETNQHPLLTLGVGISLVWIVGLHLFTALREAKLDQPFTGSTNEAGFVDVGSLDEIPENRAKIVTLAGERVAIFKYDGKLSAVSNVCQHQNGPLGEEKVVDGCIIAPDMAISTYRLREHHHRHLQKKFPPLRSESLAISSGSIPSLNHKAHMLSQR